MAEDGLLIASLVAQLKLDIADFEKKASQVESGLTPVQRVLDTVSRGASSFTSALGGTVGRLTELVGVVAGVQLGLAGLERVIAGGREAIIGYNSTLEQAQLSFSYLTGSADTAREHIQLLLDAADRSPFPHEQWLAASRSLQTLGVNLTYVPGLLDKIADAAAGLTIPFDVATQAIGRFISLTAGGQGGGYATRQLMSLGLITGSLRNELTQMEQMGKSGEAVIQRFLDSLTRFKGAAAEAAQTWEGLMTRIKSTIEETAGIAFRPLYQALEEMARRLKTALDTEAFRASMQRFAMFVLDAFQAIGNGILTLGETVSGVWGRWGTQFDNAITAWNSLPGWLKDVGILGAVLGGVKGGVAISAMLSLFQTARNSIAALKEGMPVSEWATSNAEQVRRWLAARGKVPGEGPGPMVDTSLGMAAGMVSGTSVRDQFNDALNRARRNLEAQMQGLAKPPTGAPPPEKGGLTGPPRPATLAEEQALKAAGQAFLELFPNIDEAEKKSMALQLRFEELAKQGGPYADTIRKIGEEARKLGPTMEDTAAEMALMALPLRVDTTPLKDAQDAVTILTKRVDELKLKKGEDDPVTQAWAARLNDARAKAYNLETSLKGVAAAMEQDEAAKRAYAEFVRTLEVEFRQAEDAARAFTAQFGVIRQFGEIQRGAGVEGINITGEEQQAVSTRIRQRLQEIATWTEQRNRPNLDRTSEEFRRLDEEINKAGADVETLKVKLASLQEINSLKGVISDVFGSLSRAVSTSITGIIQGTTTMKDAFNNLGQSILLSIQELIIKRAFKSLEDAFNAMLDNMMKAAQESGLWNYLLGLAGSAGRAVAAYFSGGGGSPNTGIGGNIGAPEGGGAGLWEGPNIEYGGYSAKGALVTKPTRLLAGEAGPEYIIPADEMPGASPLPEMRGETRIDMTGVFEALAGALDRDTVPSVTIIDQRGSGDIERRDTTREGKRTIELLIRDAVRGGLAAGEYDRLMYSLYGMGRVGQKR